MTDNFIHVGVYEHGQTMVPVKILSGSTVREILVLAKKEITKDGKDKKVKDVSEWEKQPFLTMEDKITRDHSEIYMGPHNDD